MTCAIIQARLGSSRLPGKVLADIEGQPMLLRVVERVKRAGNVHQVLVATSEAPANDAIRAACTAWGVRCYSGSENDVLDRYFQAATAVGARTVVRITADCPFIDPDIVERVVQKFHDSGCDYASNVEVVTFPDGLDTEVFSWEALERAWHEATRPSDREHVTAYIRTSGRFRTVNVRNEEAPEAAGMRWTVDEPEDLEFVRRVSRELASNEFFGMKDVLEALRNNSSLTAGMEGAIMNEGYYKSLFDQAVGLPAPKTHLEQSDAWLERAKKVIPGCAQTFSKGRNQYVQGAAPVFLQKGKGCRVWDVDGNEYIDYVQGLLPNILGYAHDEVNRAATEQLANGHSFSLPHPLEVELAERLCRLIPCAEMVRFGKNGSDATAGAVRAARAVTGRDRIACCGYHGWQDWYIGSTPRNAGVPAAVCGLTHPFQYNSLESLEVLLAEHPGEFAAVIMEPFNFTAPAPGFLEGVRDRIHAAGGLLIFDEICTGFHFGLGGAQKSTGVIPDLACFGKAMGNGFPIACITGRADIMRVFEDVFVSFTFAGEVASMAATMKVLDILEGTDALERIASTGRQLQDGFNALAKQAGIASQLKCIGYPTWSLVKFLDEQGNDSFLVRSLYQQELVRRGVLQLVTHNLTAAHDAVSTEKTLQVYAEVFKTLANWLSDKNPGQYLDGPMIQPVFRVR